MVVDAAGNLYGTTYGGGNSNDGTIFELGAGSSTITTLASFDGCNGSNPRACLLADAAGNLYGTTTNGGSDDLGTVFELANGSSTITTLVSFNGTNGALPIGGLIADASGNLYGTTTAGGSTLFGTIFELTNTGFVVPEPSTLTLLILTAATASARRRPH